VSAGELALVIAAVLCAVAFAALAVTLVRVRDTVTELRIATGTSRAVRRLRSEP
jgi:uncharacterized protein YoxC